MYAAEGRICSQYGLLGTKHQLDDSSRGRSHDEQTASGSLVHGFSRRELSEFGTDVT